MAFWPKHAIGLAPTRLAIRKHTSVIPCQHVLHQLRACDFIQFRLISTAIQHVIKPRIQLGALCVLHVSVCGVQHEGKVVALLLFGFIQLSEPGHHFDTPLEGCLLSLPEGAPRTQQLFLQHYWCTLVPPPLLRLRR